MFSVILILLGLTSCHSFTMTGMRSSVSLHRDTSHHFQEKSEMMTRTKRTSSTSLSMALSLNDIANKWKILKYGVTSNKPDITLECSDRKYREKSYSIDIKRTGGMGLDLVEVFEQGDGTGLVLIQEVFSDGNAGNPIGGDSLLREGDVLVGMCV